MYCGVSDLLAVPYILVQRSGNAQVVVANQGETQCIDYMSIAETTKGIKLEYRVCRIGRPIRIRFVN
jgi:hypothetical protein